MTILVGIIALAPVTMLAIGLGYLAFEKQKGELKMTIIRTCYRLVYRDGSHGPWTSDYEQAKKDAEFFRARIETEYFQISN